MANVLFGFPNSVDACALSGGSWFSGLPLSNLKTRLFSQVARSTNASVAATQFVCDLGSTQAIALASLVDHNLSTAARWRITAGADAAFTSVLFQSAWLDVWPYVGPWVLEWEQDEFWSGDLPQSRRSQYRPIALHVPAQRVWARYWRIEIDDSANPAGYVEIGRAYLSDAYQPSQNPNYGRGLGYESATVVVRGLAGNEFYDLRPAVRTLQAELDWLGEGEAYDRVLQMQRVLDLNGEVFYVEVPDDESTYMQRAFPASLRKLSPITWPSYNAHRAPIELKELV